METTSSFSNAFSHNTYQVRRKIFKLFGGAFHIYDPEGRVVFYSKLKAFKLKEDIRLYSDESMQTELLAIKARQIIDFSAAYDVVDSVTGEKAGVLKRKGFKSIFRDEWIIMNEEDREKGIIKEESGFLAFVRRVITNIIPQKYHGEIGGEKVCEFRQNFNPFVMKINLDFSADEKGLLDRRLGIAAAVLLCAVEGKQK